MASKPITSPSTDGYNGFTPLLIDAARPCPARSWWLVLVGANDEPFINATNYMAKKIPDATKVVIPDAGHASNIDQPAMFNDAVHGFLTANDL